MSKPGAQFKKNFKRLQCSVIFFIIFDNLVTLIVICRNYSKPLCNVCKGKYRYPILTWLYCYNGEIPENCT